MTGRPRVPASADDRHKSFAEIARRIHGDAPLTPEEFEEHFAYQDAGTRTGIEIGEPAPNFALPDQYGNVRSRRDLMGPTGLLLVFARSATFCPYCRNQLGELNLSADAVREQGVNVASVSPDQVDALRSFTDALDIEYPMLSDADGKLIEQFGVLNPNFEAFPSELAPSNQSATPFPGHFLLDPNGIVRDKLFTGDLRHRPSATTLVQKHFGLASGGQVVELRTEELTAAIRLSAARAFGGQELGFAVELRVSPGWHLYGKPLPQGLVPLEIGFAAGDLLSEQSLELPEPEQLSLAGAPEALPVYHGEVTAHGRLRVRWSPAVRLPSLLHFAEDRIPPGEHPLRGTLRYQACSDMECRPPRRIDFETVIVIEDDLLPHKRYPRSDGESDPSVGRRRAGRTPSSRRPG